MTEKFEEFWAIRSEDALWIRSGGAWTFSARGSLRNLIHFYSEEQAIAHIRNHMENGRKFMTHYQEFAHVPDFKEIKDTYYRARFKLIRCWEKARPVKVRIALV